MFARCVLVVFCSLIAACGRPLSDAETAFVTAFGGEAIDTAPIRIVDGHPGGSLRFTVPARPRVTCQERIWPPLEPGTDLELSPIASVLFNTVWLRSDIYSADLMAGFPNRIDLTNAMLLAHEAVHIWQWQNRDQTAYHPWRALAEHAVVDDPYLFDPDTPNRRFLDYGFEQQGALVEEYVCCRLLDPTAPRTARLRALIGQALPVEGLDAVLDDPLVRVPWAGLQPAGICRA